MTPLQISQLANEIAARIPAMAQDCCVNNAAVIEGMIGQADSDSLKISFLELQLEQAQWSQFERDH